MNFEVFSTEAEADERRQELVRQGAFVVQSFNGRLWTIKWRAP